MNDKVVNSLLIQKDVHTEKAYEMDNFDPKTQVGNYSYTSSRVMKHVYNKYQVQGKPKVFGYYTDWSQYDGRLDNKFDKGDRGAGYDLANLSPTAFDKIIFGFIGILGDQGEKKNAINAAASQQNKNKFEPLFLDPWGDFQSYRNCDQPEDWRPIDIATVTQEDTKGILGGLRDFQQKAKKLGHELALSMSIGGWTMSNIFHELAASSQSRKIFALGVVKLFKQFPMFSEIDIDWEYPNDKGNENPFGPEDGDNYVVLIKELREQLDSAGRSDVKISIAAAAVVTKIAHSKIKELLAVGLYGINLMTYDFFGTPWALELNHHTNLMPKEPEGDSVDTVINYLIAQGIPSERINIGYAGYSRNAKNAEIESFSPLKGLYDTQKTPTTGTLESGSTVWADILYNYLDLEEQCGRNGFNVYTDQIADADYLYSPESKLFLSIDTPRTVKAKGEYVVKHNLGAIFTWTIDQDNGLLVNAAREGMGCKIETQVIDMKPFYFEGINVDAKNGKDDPDQTDETEKTNHAPKGHIALRVTSGSVVQLSAQASSDEDGDKLSYQWTLPAGIVSADTKADVIEIKAPEVSAATDFSFELVVKDAKGAAAEKQYFVLTVVKSQNVKPDPTPKDYPAWVVSGHIYSKGDKVIYAGVKYICINPHTSNSGWIPGVAITLWNETV
ncbi:glycosyl hydrolase family 18 protein [Rouxiella sp. WC2420]|uniref:chitinase n=1 Tax=Rouxiella sp. WC2420 TaxID=3234145 RepID=A0AB39VLX3_9GAMM